MTGYLLTMSGVLDDLPVRMYPTKELAIGAAKAYGIDIDTGVETGAALAPQILRDAADVFGRGPSASIGWTVVQFADGVPVRAWNVGHDDEWTPEPVGPLSEMEAEDAAAGRFASLAAGDAPDAEPDAAGSDAPEFGGEG